MGKRRLSILMIEDSPSDAELIQDMLSSTPNIQFEVEHVERLELGLQRLAQRHFDCVLLDFGLPDSRGLPTFRSVHDFAPSIPVVVLTNQDDEVMAENAVQEGAQDYLLKRDATPRVLERSIRYAVDRHDFENVLRENQERFSLALDGTNHGVWDWNLLSGEVYYSPRWKSIVGCEEDELGTAIEDWFERIHPDDLTSFRHEMDSHLRGESNEFHHEVRVKSCDDSWVWVECAGKAQCSVTSDGRSNKAHRMTGSMSDITGRKAAEEQLKHDALHDALTGLPNRTLFAERLTTAAQRTRRQRERGFAVMFLDLDRFKTVNDSLGHAVGDELLVLISERLEICLRDGDTLARFGGDEFALLVRDLNDVREATLVARRIQRAFRKSFRVGEQELHVTTSVGIAMSSERYDDNPEEMLRDADIAMYRAKDAGGDRCEVFDRDMHERALTLLKLESDLQVAVKRDGCRDFELHYQPIIQLASGRIHGFEALIRWRKDDGKLISPLQFIPLAEETGLIDDITWWVLDRACRQLREWQIRHPRKPSLYVSVNFSGRTFKQRDVVERIVDTLTDAEIQPNDLRIEVTENIFLDHDNGVLDKLNQLRTAGVKLYMDDFGTGFSSLSYLGRFRYDSVKIDRSFVGEMDTKKSAGFIVDSILALGERLEFDVVAEGIESGSQLASLRQQNCSHGQGYFFSRPLEPVAAGQMLETDPKW